MLTSRFVRHLYFFAASAVLIGCASPGYRSELTPANSVSSSHLSDAASLPKQLEESALRYKLIYVADRLQPEVNAQPGTQNNVVIHTYSPYDFAGGPQGYAQAVFEEAFGITRPTTVPENVRFIGIDLKEADTRILHGNLISGKFGRYYAKVVAQVRVTDHKGKVLVNDAFSAEQQTVRNSFTGMQPSLEQDKGNMRLTYDTALKAVAAQVVEELL